MSVFSILLAISGTLGGALTYFTGQLKFLVEQTGKKIEFYAPIIESLLNESLETGENRNENRINEIASFLCENNNLDIKKELSFLEYPKSQIPDYIDSPEFGINKQDIITQQNEIDENNIKIENLQNRNHNNNNNNNNDNISDKIALLSNDEFMVALELAAAKQKIKDDKKREALEREERERKERERKEREREERERQERERENRERENRDREKKEKEEREARERARRENKYNQPLDHSPSGNDDNNNIIDTTASTPGDMDDIGQIWKDIRTKILNQERERELGRDNGMSWASFEYEASKFVKDRMREILKSWKSFENLPLQMKVITSIIFGAVGILFIFICLFLCRNKDNKNINNNNNNNGEMLDDNFDNYGEMSQDNIPYNNNNNNNNNNKDNENDNYNNYNNKNNNDNNMVIKNKYGTFIDDEDIDNPQKLNEFNNQTNNNNSSSTPYGTNNTNNNNNNNNSQRSGNDNSKVKRVSGKIPGGLAARPNEEPDEYNMDENEGKDSESNLLNDMNDMNDAYDDDESKRELLQPTDDGLNANKNNDNDVLMDEEEDEDYLNNNPSPSRGSTNSINSNKNNSNNNNNSKNNKNNKNNKNKKRNKKNRKNKKNRNNNKYGELNDNDYDYDNVDDRSKEDFWRYGQKKIEEERRKSKELTYQQYKRSAFLGIGVIIIGFLLNEGHMLTQYFAR